MLRRLIFTLALMSAASLTLAEAVKISGFVSGSANGTKFTLGSSKGRFTVETAGAKVTLNGRAFDASKLTGGSQVTVEGELTGKTVRAKSVVVGNLRGAPQAPGKPSSRPVASSDPRKPAKPAAASSKSKPGTSAPKSKPKGKRDDLPTDSKPKDAKRGPMPVIGKSKPVDPKSSPKDSSTKTGVKKPASKVKPKASKPADKPKAKPKTEAPTPPSRSDGR